MTIEFQYWNLIGRGFVIFRSISAAPWFSSATRLLYMLVGDILRCNNFKILLLSIYASDDDLALVF